MMLVTEGESTADDAKLQIWQGQLGSKGCWWYLELATADNIQSADLGQAPKP